MSRRADLVGSLLWLGLGLAVIQQSWTMDRLQAQGADPWSAPGLVPGIIGLVLVILGLALLVRSLRAPAEVTSGEAAAEDGSRGRLALTLALCLAFVFGLIGRGMPFWLAAAIFIAAFFAAFTWRERGLPRSAAIGAVYGLLMGVLIHLLFEEVFLVRLP